MFQSFIFNVKLRIVQAFGLPLIICNAGQMKPKIGLYRLRSFHGATLACFRPQTYYLKNKPRECDTHFRSKSQY